MNTCFTWKAWLVWGRSKRTRSMPDWSFAGQSDGPTAAHPIKFCYWRRRHTSIVTFRRVYLWLSYLSRAVSLPQFALRCPKLSNAFQVSSSLWFTNGFLPTKNSRCDVWGKDFLDYINPEAGMKHMIDHWHVRRHVLIHWQLSHPCEFCWWNPEILLGKHWWWYLWVEFTSDLSLNLAPYHPRKTPPFSQKLPWSRGYYPEKPWFSSGFADIWHHYNGGV